MLDKNELLFDELYEKTKDCGRVQFINLLMEKEREIKQLKNTINKAKDYINTTEYSDIVGLNSYSIKDFWFVKELLEILNNKGE